LNKSDKESSTEEGLGRKECPQAGQRTGIEYTVAASSMSGAINLFPQAGHLVLKNPLSIFY
jgi:hypothetical protein